jgi:hypothetical protein
MLYVAHGRMVMTVMMVMTVIMVVIVVMVMVVIMVMVMVVIMVMLMVVVVVVIMVVMVVMRLFFLPVHENTEMRADDAAFHRRLNGKSNARQADCIHLADERILVVQKFIQGGGEHVAGRTHSAIQIQRFHCLSL